MSGETGRRLLAKAAAEQGGVEALAHRLGMSEKVMRHYIQGKDPIPDEIVLKVIDIILGDAPDRSD